MDNIFFTGLSGFIGQEFLKYCNTQDNCDFKILEMPKNYKSEKNSYNYAFKPDDFEDKIDVLVHAGAFSPKTREQMEDAELNMTNVINTEYLLKNLPNFPKKIIYISTVSVYSLGQKKITEDSSLGGDSVYGLSKLMCEKIIENYAKEHNIEYQILRLSVVYGNNPKVQGLIPTFIKNICENKDITVFNNGKQKKNFVNVYDVARVIYKSVKEPVKYNIINIAGDSSISVKDVAEILINASGKNVKITNVSNKKSDDIIFDNKKMKKAFGKNEITYEKGLMNAFKELSGVYSESM